MGLTGLQGLGALLIIAGFTPTPDDITVISPIIQIALGTILLIVGRKKK